MCGIIADLIEKEIGCTEEDHPDLKCNAKECLPALAYASFNDLAFLEFYVLI